MTDNCIHIIGVSQQTAVFFCTYKHYVSPFLKQPLSTSTNKSIIDQDSKSILFLALVFIFHKFNLIYLDPISLYK